MRISINITRRAILAILAVSVIGTAAAAITLFTHTFPAVTVTTAVLSTTCATLTATPNNVLAGSSGQIVFTCGMNAAFTSVTTGSATPTFTLPAGYTSLSIPAHPAANCGGGLILTSGGTPSFGLAGAQFDYCASFTSAPAGGFATFTVEWSQ